MWKKRFVARNFKVEMQRMVNRLLKDGCPIRRIEMETLNRCNCTCSFCPVSIGHDIRKPKYMSDKLFTKIMDDLSLMDYDGSLYLSSNNEPFLDAKLVERLGKAREACPEAFLALYTNGSMLTPDKYHGAMKSLDLMFIDSYTEKGNGLTPQLMSLAECMTEEENERTIIYKRLLNEVADTRGGLSPSRKKCQTLDLSCTNIFSEMVITPDGTVSVCCQDAYNRYVMGDLKVNGILEVWHGPIFSQVREHFLKYGRSAFAICRTCDFYRRSIEETMMLKTFKVEKTNVQIERN